MHAWRMSVSGSDVDLPWFTTAAYTDLFQVRVGRQFELSAALECGALAPLWPKRQQAAALQGGAQFKLTPYPCTRLVDNSASDKGAKRKDRTSARRLLFAPFGSDLLLILI